MCDGVRVCLESPDERGKVLIWALNSKRIKLEVQACRSIADLAWSDDGQKVCAVGDGAEALAKVFTWDSGNNVGAIEVGFLCFFFLFLGIVFAFVSRGVESSRMYHRDLHSHGSGGYL
jgi:hypothetical protein